LVQSEEYKNFGKSLRRGEFVSGEFERVNKNGESVWLFGTYTPLQNTNGEYYKVLKIAVDVTAQHKAEEEVKQKDVYLEHAALKLSGTICIVVLILTSLEVLNP
jgi:methyl-accepting chemotaxis protein